jgi:hypothetical protein
MGHAISANAGDRADEHDIVGSQITSTKRCHLCDPWGNEEKSVRISIASS